MKDSKQEKDNTMFLVGDFTGAHVHVGDRMTRSIDAADLQQKFHDVSHKGTNYRFVNASEVSQQTVETFKTRGDAVVFDGDLHGMLITVNSGGIQSQYVDALDMREPDGP